MSEQQIKYWNKALKFHLIEPKKAIELYLKALECEIHPFLYTNIAECYKFLNDKINEAKYYLLAEENGLLELDYKYSSNPYNSYAWYLYETKQDYEKALIYSKISLDIEPDKESHLDTYIRINFALNNQNEALRCLKKLSEINNTFKDSLDLFELYKEELKNYSKNFFKTVNKEELLLKIFNDNNTHQNVIDYVLGNTTVIDYNYIETSDILITMFKNNFDFEDIYFSRFLIYLNEKQMLYSFYSVLYEVYKENKTALYTAYKALKKAEIEETKIINFLIDYFGSNFEEELSKFISENLTEEIENIILKKLKTIESTNYVIIFSKALLHNNYDKHIDFVKKVLMKLPYSLNTNKLLYVIKDDEFVKNIYIKRILGFIKSYNKKNKYPEIETEIEKYLTIENYEITDKIKEFGKKFEKRYENYFYDYFIEHSTYKYKRNGIFYQKTLELSFILDKFTTEYEIFKEFNYSESFNYERLKEVIYEYNLQISQAFDYFCGEFKENKDVKFKKYIIKLIEDNFDILGNFVQNSQKNYILQTLTVFYKINPEKTYKILIFIVNNNPNPKFEAKLIKLLLNYTDKITDFRKFADSNNLNTRKIGKELLKKIN